MFRILRQSHKWVGVVASLLLVVLATTGFLLATKGKIEWMRPPEAKAEKVESPAEIVSVQVAVEAAFAKGIPELRTMKDVDRVDYRPKSNIFKIISKEGYQEVQVDGKTGKVLTVSFRNDQLAEDIHDFSIFSDLMHEYGLPITALGLLTLAISGIGMFFTPIFRKRKFFKEKAHAVTGKSGQLDTE